MRAGTVLRQPVREVMEWTGALSMACAGLGYLGKVWKGKEMILWYSFMHRFSTPWFFDWKWLKMVMEGGWVYEKKTQTKAACQEWQAAFSVSLSMSLDMDAIESGWLIEKGSKKYDWGTHCGCCISPYPGWLASQLTKERRVKEKWRNENPGRLSKDRRLFVWEV